VLFEGVHFGSLQARHFPDVSQHSLQEVNLDAGKCRLDIVVIAEVIKEHDLWAYPYNALRNQALSRATTDVSLPLPGGGGGSSTAGQMGEVGSDLKSRWKDVE